MDKKESFEQEPPVKSTPEKGARAIENLHSVIKSGESSQEFRKDIDVTQPATPDAEATHVTERMLHDAQKTFIEESHPDKDEADD